MGWARGGKKNGQAMAILIVTPLLFATTHIILGGANWVRSTPLSVTERDRYIVFGILCYGFSIMTSVC